MDYNETRKRAKSVKSLNVRSAVVAGRCKSSETLLTFNLKDITIYNAFVSAIQLLPTCYPITSKGENQNDNLQKKSVSARDILRPLLSLISNLFRSRSRKGFRRKISQGRKTNLKSVHSYFQR